MDESARRMIEFIEARLEDRETRVELDTPLVSSGLVDSFALVEVLTRLQEVTNRAIPNGRVAPQDLETVAAMLKMATRFPERKP